MTPNIYTLLKFGINTTSRHHVTDLYALDLHRLSVDYVVCDAETYSALNPQLIEIDQIYLKIHTERQGNPLITISLGD